MLKVSSPLIHKETKTQEGSASPTSASLRAWGLVESSRHQDPELTFLVPRDEFLCTSNHRHDCALRQESQ